MYYIIIRHFPYGFWRTKNRLLLPLRRPHELDLEAAVVGGLAVAAAGIVETEDSQKNRYHLPILFSPGTRVLDFPSQTNVPPSPAGSLTVPETRPPENVRFSTTYPFGVEVFDRIQLSGPGFGEMRTDLKPGSAGFTPATPA